jgi:asparagine synthase (glutamine-hydrolysing)
VPTYYVSKAAKEHVTVVLAGDGGDENFAGYRRYYFFQRENLLRGLLPGGINRTVFGTLANLYPKADWTRSIFRGKATVQNLARSPIEAYFRAVSAVQSEVKAQLLHGDLRHHLRDYDSLDVLRAYYDKADRTDSLSRIQYVDIKTYLTDDILVKVDRASMANSLEVRAPLLDHKLMELAATMPASIKLRGKNGKYILKKALERYLPESILYRSKMGFAVPIARWFRTDIKDLAHDVLTSSNSETLLNAATVKQLWSEHQSGLRDRSTELWTLLIFRLWERQFMADVSRGKISNWEARNVETRTNEL